MKHELRKVQRTSSGTFFVCLPKKWAERIGLKRGAVVAVSEMTDGRLALDPKYDVERGPREAVVKPSAYLSREITGKYLLGYDIIRVEAENRISSEDRKQVKQAAAHLVGLEIVEEDYSKIVMQCLLKPSTFPPDKILRREHSIAAGMHRDTVTALIEGDVQLAKNVIARDNEVNRLYFLLVRILRTVIQNPGLGEKLDVRPIDCLDYRLVASLVESIGDQSVHMAKKVLELGGVRLSKELAQLFLKFHSEVFTAHEKALEAFFSHNVSLRESVRGERDKIVASIRKVEAAVGGESNEVAPHLLTMVSLMSRIYDNSVDVADLVMPRTE
ncbi:MAG: phosphate uptake regulator PhoU [Thermoproteota archaeon]|nr:phosphate uptake regulator PhoU [Thermoproteota archaeon]